MRMIKLTFVTLFILWVPYVIYLYAFSPKVTYLIPQNYEGPLLIIANQKNGIVVNRKNVVFDFTRDNVIRLKGDLITGFFPWGYLNYIAVDKVGNEVKLEVTDNLPEKANVELNKIYLWSEFHRVGGFELRNGSKVSYESLIVSRESNVNKYLNQESTILLDIIK